MRVSVELEYIDKLRDKISCLEKLIKQRDSEIEGYREVLKEIGAKLDVYHEKMEEPIVFNSHSKPIPLRDEVKIVHICLDRRFACSRYYENELCKINAALEEYGKRKDRKYDR